MTGRTREQIVADFEGGDNYMSAEQALEYGLIDRIMQLGELAPVVQVAAEEIKKETKEEMKKEAGATAEEEMKMLGAQLRRFMV